MIITLRQFKSKKVTLFDQNN